MTLTPQLYETDDQLPRDLVVLRRFARLMDEAIAIPGTNRKFGLDAAIGLIPGVGDAAGALLSSWIVIGAFRHRVALPVIFRMIANVLLDLLVGSIPLLGDIFDFLWEENVMNLDLLLKHRNRQKPPRSIGQIGVVATVVLLLFLAIVVGMVALSVWIAIMALRSIGK